MTPRIGGLTIEEFVHFLALLERVKEQHGLDSSAGGPGQQHPQERNKSPYDNNHHQGVSVAVATSPRMSQESTTSDQDSSDSSTCGSSGAPSPDGSSSSACSGDFDLPVGVGGFSPLERLFLRRYLHVIPEEALNGGGSECDGSRLSRALSGISSALSFLADGDDRGSFDSGEEEDVVVDDSLLPAVFSSQGHLIPTTLDEDIRPNSYVEDAPEEKAAADHFVTVTALPALVVDISNDSSSSGADEVAPRPRVLEELEERETAECCRVVDESLLPVSVAALSQETDGDSPEEEPPGCPVAAGEAAGHLTLSVQPSMSTGGDCAGGAEEEDDASESTSVVTLIDERIVSVDYRPPTICSAQLLLLAEAQEPPPDGQDPNSDDTVATSRPNDGRIDSNQEETKDGPEEADGPVQVSQLLKFWEKRCDPDGSSSAAPPRLPISCETSIKPLQLASNWPPPPPPLPDSYEPYRTATSASETETGYSTDGSESVLRQRRLARPPPPCRPTPPLDYRPEPPVRRSFVLATGDDAALEEDERTKARLLAAWLSSSSVSTQQRQKQPDDEGELARCSAARHDHHQPTSPPH